MLPVCCNEAVAIPDKSGVRFCSGSTRALSVLMNLKDDVRNAEFYGEEPFVMFRALWGRRNDHELNSVKPWSDTPNMEIINVITIVRFDRCVNSCENIGCCLAVHQNRTGTRNERKRPACHKDNAQKSD